MNTNLNMKKTKTMFVCKSDLSLKNICFTLQSEYNLPLFIFDEHSTWEYAYSQNAEIEFNVTKTQKLNTLASWQIGIPDNVNYQVIVNVVSDRYSIKSIKIYLNKLFVTDIMEI